MNDSTIVSAFFLGLAGTGHCIGMCGPLVVAIPGRAKNFSAHLFYHAGRTATYAAVGCLMGGIGAGLAGLAGKIGADPVSWFSRIQVFFSLIAAGFLFWFGISRMGFVQEPSWMSTSSPERVPGYGKVMKWAVLDKKPAGMFFIGLTMGFLPCGLSFAAFARALAAPGPLAGGLLLSAFAIGTLPGLLLLGAGASGFFGKFRKHSDVLSGILMIAMGCSLAADVLFSSF
jgi:sulfite exporter TauE/SafE